MIDFALFALLILGSILFLRSIVNEKIDQRIEEEDQIFAEVMLPLSRLVAKLDKESIKDFEDDLWYALDDGYDELVIITRKWAWRHGVKINQEETHVMYKHLRKLEMSEEEQTLYNSIKQETENILVHPSGLIVLKEAYRQHRES